MTGSSLVAKRYARALARLVEKNQQQEGQGHLMALSFVKSLFAIEDARKVLSSPVMPQKLKKELLDLALDQGKADVLVRHFVYTVLEAERVALLPSIISAYEDLLNEQSGRIRAVLTTALALPTEEVDGIRQNLQEALSKSVEVRTEVDPSLLGGMMVHIGHFLVDLSLRTKLNALTNSAAL